MTELFRDVPASTIACTDAGDAGLLSVVVCPDGTVESRSGTFTLNAEGAQSIIATFNQHKVDVPIDYEHQTLGDEYASPDGTAPAAGWIKALSYKPGIGLVASVEWTERGRAMIRGGAIQVYQPRAAGPQG